MPLYVQWNLSIAATLGEQHYGRYTGVAFVEGFLVYVSSVQTRACGRYIAVGCCSGVVVKRSFTVFYSYRHNLLPLLGPGQPPPGVRRGRGQTDPGLAQPPREAGPP